MQLISSVFFDFLIALPHFLGRGGAVLTQKSKCLTNFNIHRTEILPQQMKNLSKNSNFASAINKFMYKI